MAGFMDKLKQSASKVTDMAQQTVEVTKLSTQITSKKKEIEKRFTLIGEAVYHGNINHDLTSVSDMITSMINEIDSCQQDIMMLEQKISELKNEKVCTCGQVVALDVKFCPACGVKFVEDRIIVTDSEQLDADLELPEHTNDINSSSEVIVDSDNTD